MTRIGAGRGAGRGQLPGRELRKVCQRLRARCSSIERLSSCEASPVFTLRSSAHGLSTFQGSGCILRFERFIICCNETRSLTNDARCGILSNRAGEDGWLETEDFRNGSIHWGGGRQYGGAHQGTRIALDRLTVPLKCNSRRTRADAPLGSSGMSWRPLLLPGQRLGGTLARDVPTPGSRFSPR